MSARISVASPRKKTNRVFVNLVVVLISVSFLLPLVWVVTASFDLEAGLSAAVPKTWSVDNYRAVLTPETTFTPLLNSLFLSASVAVLTVLIAILAAYPLSRYQSRFHGFYLYTILFISGLPITAMMIPVYALFVNLDLLDSLPAVALFLTASALPMAIFMMKNFMDTIPVSLEEAAWIDGASAMTALRRVVVPLMKPGIAAVTVFVFVSVWGNFFVPFILLVTPEKLPAAVTIYSFFGQHGTVGYGELAAFSIIYTLPAVALYLIITRSLGAFALAGGVKG